MIAAGEAVAILSGAPLEPALVGGKGAALNQLMAAGMNVPPTGAVTTVGYRRFIEHSGLSRFLTELAAAGPPAPTELDREVARVDEAFLEAAMPVELADQIRRLADTVSGGSLLAVRSSATAEDTVSASFAGQYRSILEVDDEALLESVRLVWSSLWHPAPSAYRAHAGVTGDGLAMAVVIMRMVDAVRAGVVFTINPTGDSTEMRVAAVDGLAEQLVSGLVTPDSWVVSRIEAHRPSIDPVIDEVIDTALDIEARFGRPQDVEWAHDGEQLFIVQARPITTLAIEGKVLTDGFDSVIGVDDTYTTAGIAESMPGVLPPLQWTTAGPLLENGFRHLFDQMEALPALADEKRFLARVNGRAALSLDLMKAAALEVPGGSSDEIERQYFGRVVSADATLNADETLNTDETQGANNSSGTDVTPDRGGTPGADPAKKGPFKGLRSMFVGVREINARRRFRFEAEASIDAIERLLLDPLERNTATTDELLTYRNRLLDLADRVVSAEVAVAASAAAAYRGVELFLETHVGDRAALLAQQLTAGGIDTCSAQVALHMCKLADEALADAELSAAVVSLDTPAGEMRQKLARLGRGSQLIADMDAELSRAGSTAMFAGETWAESDSMAWQLLTQAVQVERRGPATIATPEDRIRLLSEVEHQFTSSFKYRMQRLLTGQLVDLRKRMLHRLVEDAVEFLYLREKTKSGVLALGGEVRRVHLAIGSRLVDAGVLDDPADVDLLAAYELEPVAHGRAPTHWELDRRRSVLEALRDAGPVPQLFTGDPSRGVNRVIDGDESTFQGWAASAGVYEGVARVITGASEPIGPGEILVARTTDPSWTPLFLTAGAIVVEEGGPLSHAAIIAREFKLPAVLNVPGLIDRLTRDGLGTVKIRVDGDQGTVEVLDGADRCPAPVEVGVSS